MRRTLFFISSLWLSSLFSGALWASEAEDLDPDEKAYAQALVRLGKMDVDRGNSGEDAPLVGWRAPRYLIMQFLDIDGLIKIRRTAKSLYYSEAVKWLGLRLNDQIYHQYAHPQPRQIKPGGLLPLFAAEMRSILCMHRRLQQKNMKPTEAELSFIEQNLALRERYQIARAYLPALRGKGSETYHLLKSLADAGDPRAQILITCAIRWGEWGLLTPRKELSVIANSQRLASFGQGYAKKLIAGILYNRAIGKQGSPELAELKDIAARGGHGAGMSARVFIAVSINEGKFGYDTWPMQARFEALREIAAAGGSEANRSAQTLLARALDTGALGQKDRPEEERWAELEGLAKGGNPYAQQREALVKGRGPRSEVLANLESMAREGNIHAESRLVEIICELNPPGSLPPEERSEASRFAKLRARAAEGSLPAHKAICKAIYEGTLGQKARPAAERLAELEDMASRGDSWAQMLLADSLFESALDPRPRRGDDDGLAGLKMMASGGSSIANLYAQELINAVEWWTREQRAIDRGAFIRRSKIGALEFAELKAKSSTGILMEDMEDVEGNIKFIDAIYEGSLGQRYRSPADRFGELCALSSASDPRVRRQAKAKIGLCLCEGSLGQSVRPEEERLAALQAMAVTCQKDIQWNRIRRLRDEEPSFFWLHYDFYNALLEALAPESTESE